MDIDALKAAVTDSIDASRSKLVELSLKIHSDPELGFHETHAAALLTSFLEDAGFQVERGICDMETAFRAAYGKGSPVIALLAEYDALPEIGHACGHNIISVASVGAALALRQAVDSLGGTVQVIGTPAEELYGGKAMMEAKGAFESLDAAMITHPGTANVATVQALAAHGLTVEFHGKPAHAAASPQEGINALDAMVLSFNGINALRQHIRSTARVHGIITHGGEASNVIPAYTRGIFLVRAAEDDYLEELKEKVLNCFRGAALATGARLEFEWDAVRYASVNNNLTLARLYADNMHSLGREVLFSDPENFFGSTDMGNVTQLVPGIHPFIAIAEPGISIHTEEFARAAASDAGMNGLVDAAKSMAMTVVEVLADPALLKTIKDEFSQGSSV